MIDAGVLILAAIALVGSIYLIGLYWKMPRRCRSKELKAGKLSICGGERTQDGVVVKEGWLFNTSWFGHAEFSIEELPCRFKLGGEALIIECERPVKVRP